jgi:hypothetical protein
MSFSPRELELARELSFRGLPWNPQVGHFVFDSTGFVERSSPFQEHVYFILNFEYFMQLVGGADRFKEIMVWLPTWEHCREILRSCGVSDADVLRHLCKHEAIESGNERVVLYELILSRFPIPGDVV